jgi:hypothetical protein
MHAKCMLAEQTARYSSLMLHIVNSDFPGIVPHIAIKENILMTYFGKILFEKIT